MLKPYSFLFYFISIIFFFFIGIFYAGWVEAGKGQMLTAGPIVVFSGLIGAFLGLVFSLILINKLESKIAKILSLFMAVSIICFFLVFFGKYKKRLLKRAAISQLANELPELKKAVDNVDIKDPKSTVNNLLNAGDKLLNSKLGPGMFKPIVADKTVLYFYDYLNRSKNPDGSSPVDSVVFAQDQSQNISIKSSPNWMNPEHLKLDYDIFYLKANNRKRDFIEVEVDKKSGKTYFVHKDAGKLLKWSDFLLEVHSIEIPQSSYQSIRSGPKDDASEVIIEHDILQPLEIKGDWIKVKITDESYNQLGTGWIKWKIDGKLAVEYNLLS